MEIVANAWKIHKIFNVEAFEQLLRADPRELKDLRAMRGPSSENDFTFRLDGMGGIVVPRDILVKETL